MSLTIITLFSISTIAILCIAFSNDKENNTGNNKKNINDKLEQINDNIKYYINKLDQKGE